MNTKTKTQFIYSDLAEKAIEIGRQKHWRFKVVGYGQVPNRPFYRGAWWFEPVKELPDGKDRLDALRASGIDFKGFVVAHEVVLVETKPETKIQTQTPDILPVLGDVFKIVGQVTLSLLLLTAQAVLIDPALIVILEDGTWLEVMTWYD